MFGGRSGPLFVGQLGGGSGGETIVIFLVILIVFGAKRLPEVAQSLGKSLREFRKAARDVIDEEILSQAPPPRSSPGSYLPSMSGEDEEKRRVSPPRGAETAAAPAEVPAASPTEAPPPPASVD